LSQLPIGTRLEGALALKEAGNGQFREKAYSAAVEQYEAALGSFKWAKQHDADWKKKGIRDETIELVDEIAPPAAEQAGSGADADARREARRQVAAFAVSCYNNLGACYLARAALPAEPGNSADGAPHVRAMG
jgi:hypothetical protein